MKKLVVLLTVLIATPVFALSIDMNEVSPGVVEIQYSDANALNLPRAFALEFTVDAPATITLTPGSFKTGESTSGDPGFGIYPARIIVEANGTVLPGNYGNPLADPCDPYPGGGDGSGNLVLESGSLYVGDSNSPLTDDTICTLTIDCNGAAVDVNLTMVDEDIIRGGVLLEDGTPVAVDQTILITCGDDMGCLIVGQVVGGNLITQTMWNLWDIKGRPNSWCYDCHFRGDIDNDCTIGGTDIGGYSPTTGWQYSFATAYTPSADIDNDGTIGGTDIGGFSPTSGWSYGFSNQCPPGCVPGPM